MALMKEIEEELYKIHEEARKQKEESLETEQEVTSSQQSTVDRLSPFAVIDKVDSGSPAETSVRFLLASVHATIVFGCFVIQ